MLTRMYCLRLCLSALCASCCAVAGCSGRPDPAEYGEVVTEVPAGLNRPFPLPELELAAEEPADAAAETPEKTEAGPSALPE
jgi:hypothetical protein